MRKQLIGLPRLLRKTLRIQFSIPTVSANSEIHNAYDSNIGAAVLLTVDRIADSIQDCDRAIEINKNFVKVNYLIFQNS